jgi:cob(I)alamin adenosyltransferase
MKGYLQVYTGDGKGKTTAALGLSLRAAGAGLKVYIAQFLKQGQYSEIKALEQFSQNIEIEQFGQGMFIKNKPTQDEIHAAQAGLEKARQQLISGQFDLVILEEGNVASSLGLFSVQDLLALIDQKPDHVELVITGRGAVPEVIAQADLVTEMKAVKHYYDQGVQARIGIEK